MQFLNSLLQFLQQGLAWIFRFIGQVWQWTIAQVSAVPWNRLNDLSLIKVILLVAVAGTVVYLLYKAAREILEAGKKLLAAFATVLTVFVNTLPYILIAGIVAAVGAWAINNVNI